MLTMNNIEQWRKAGEWGCSLRYSGTLALLEVASKAADKQLAGVPWTPMGVCQEYAEENGRTQWSVWRAINYALLHSRVCLAPRDAIMQLVEVVCGE